MILFYIALLGLALTVINVFTVRTVKNRAFETTESIDVLIPMRNESTNVEAVLTSVQASAGCKKFEIYVLDDNSSDNTSELVSKFNVNALAGRPLPVGWLGKNFALQQLSLASTNEFIVFVDADVRLSPNAISSSIQLLRRLDWDFISPYPRQVTGSLMEKLIQPLLQWSWLASVPLRLAEYIPNRRMTIANGQFFIVKRDAYEAIGRHEAIKGEVLDDLELARTLISNGFKGNVADGSKIASCRMYQSGLELVSGYTKSIWRAFGGVFGAFIAITLLVATGILPLILLNSAYLLIIFSRAIAAIKTRSNPIYSLLHPFSILVLIYIFLLSILKHRRGTLEWRGRILN